jgi:predicted glycosyltransferase
MRVIIDLKHPGDVHLFRHVVEELRREGDEVLVASRDKDETLVLLEQIGLEAVCLSRMGSGPAGMALELVRRTGGLVRLARRFRPHVMAGRTAVCAGLAGLALGVPVVTVDDTEFAWAQIALSVPLARVVCTGLGYGRRFPGKERRFSAPPQLAYTHPCRLRPDRERLVAGGVDPDEPYFVVRVKAWRASHDFGVAPPRGSEVEELVEGLAAFGRPLVSAEGVLLPRLARFANPLPAAGLLDLLAFARLYVGEGSTMAAEAACLGTPAVFISPRSRRGYLDAMAARYGHVATVRTYRAALRQARVWLVDGGVAGRGRAAARRLAAECDDPVRAIVEAVRWAGLRGRVRDGGGRGRGCLGRLGRGYRWGSGAVDADSP